MNINAIQDDSAGAIVNSDDHRGPSGMAIAAAIVKNDERGRALEPATGDRATPDSPMTTSIVENSGPISVQMRWNGKKGAEGVWQSIISEMPPHTVFIEAFAGTGTISRLKKPCGRSLVIDSDAAAPAFNLPGVTALCGDALTLIPTLLPKMTSEWVVYLDPPYLASVRSNPKRNYYANEFKTVEQHTALLKLILQLPARVMISGYWSDLYRQMLAEWRAVEIGSVNRGGNRTVEVVWCNFSEPFQFHDTRFLGKNCRERERIKRKRHRWKAKLQRMSRLDRAAVLDAIDELRSESNPNKP